MIGIKRLAQHLNVSIGTVSRALNNRPDVNDETRKRVLEAARELGYVANQSGRSLRRGQTGVACRNTVTFAGLDCGLAAGKPFHKSEFAGSIVDSAVRTGTLSFALALSFHSERQTRP